MSDVLTVFPWGRGWIVGCRLCTWERFDRVAVHGGVALRRRWAVEHAASHATNPPPPAAPVSPVSVWTPASLWAPVDNTADQDTQRRDAAYRIIAVRILSAGRCTVADVRDELTAIGVRGTRVGAIFNSMRRAKLITPAGWAESGNAQQRNTTRPVRAWVAGDLDALRVCARREALV